MLGRLKKKAGIARIIWIICVTVFFGSVAAMTVFYYSFGDELIADAVRRVVERTVGYRVFLEGIRLVSPGRVTVEGMDLTVGSTVFSSGPATLEFRLGINPPLTIKKVIVHDPSIWLDISGPGGGDGERIIQRLMEMDIVIVDGRLVVIDTEKRYTFLAADMSYERGIMGTTLTISGMARTEGGGDGLVLAGPLHGSMRISGAYPDVSVRGILTAGQLGYRIGGYLFLGERLNTRVRVDRDVIEATDVQVGGLLIAENERGLRLDSITATGGMKKEKNGPFTLSDVRLSVPRFGDVRLDLVVDEGGRWEVTSASDSLTLSSENLLRLGDFVPGFLTGWQLKGRLRSVLKMGTAQAGDGSITGNLEVGLINAGFSSPDSVYLGEGIYGDLRLRFRDDMRRGFIFDGQLEAHDFGLLLSNFFMNFEKKRITARASGTLDDNGGVKGLACEISIPSVLSARVSGDVDRDPTDPRSDLSYRLTAHDMGNAFDLFLRDFFRNRVEWLYGSIVTGSFDSRGRIGGDLSSPRLSGSFTVADSTIEFPDIDTRIEGISASMPFSIDLSDTAKNSQAPRFTPGQFGKVSFTRAMVGGVPINGITVSPALAENALAFREDVVLSVSGGAVEIGSFSATDIFRDSRTVSLSLHVEGVDIAGIFPKEKSVNLQGELSGDLGEVRIAEKKLFTSGILAARIFEGEVTVGKIWGQDIFDAGRRFGCDVTFADIDLGALTQTIDVGSVTGIAEGRISDLIFSYGGPERFAFDIQTVEKRGVRKRVSVEFVDKLTILGSGSTLFSGLLKGGLSRFVSDYNYSKIGIHLELENDYFTLRGTIHEGNTEYFIKRSGLTGINVINQNPNNRIRFDDMMRRLERINVKNTEDIKIETR